MVRDLHQTNSGRDREEDAPEPPQIRRFRRLVSFTMIAMVVGILGIMGALVWKLTQSPQHNYEEIIAGQIDVPEGFDIITVSRSGLSLLLVLENQVTDDRLLEERDARTQQVIGRYRLTRSDE